MIFFESIKVTATVYVDYCIQFYEKRQSCPTLCDPMDCSLPGSSVHGILQARIWNGLSFPSPGDLPNPGTEPSSLTSQADSFPYEPQGKPLIS